MSTIFSALKQLLQKSASWSLCLLSFVRGSSPLPPTARSGQHRLHHLHNVSWTWYFLELSWKCSSGLYCLVGNFLAIDFTNNIMVIVNIIYSSISMVSIAMIIIVRYYHPSTVAPEQSSVAICNEPICRGQSLGANRMLPISQAVSWGIALVTIFWSFHRTAAMFPQGSSYQGCNCK